MNNIFFASTNETCESNLHNLHLTVKSPRWWKFVHHSLKMCGEISTVGVYNRPGLYCTALACTVCQLAFSLHLFLYEQRCRLLLGALSSVLCLHLQTKNISYTLVKKNKQTQRQTLTKSIGTRAGMLLQPGQSCLKVSPGLLTKSVWCCEKMHMKSQEIGAAVVVCYSTLDFCFQFST